MRRPERWMVSAPLRSAFISIAFSLFISLPVLLFVYHQTDILFEQRVHADIGDRQRALLYGLRTNGQAGLLEAIREEVATGSARNGAVLLLDGQRRRIAGNVDTGSTMVGDGWEELELYPQGSRRPVLFTTRTVAVPGNYRLLVGTSLDDRDRMRASLLEALIGALLLALPLGLVGGFVLLRITERRARAVGLVASRIAAGDFSHRLDEQAEGEGFATIAAAINAMLERIEELVEQLRLVTDSLAHDLRSPLTRIRVNVEKISRYASAELEQQALEAISGDIDGMLRLISATLEIGRAEAGMGRQHFTDFNLAELVQDIGDIYQPVAEDCGMAIAVETAGPTPYHGDRQLIGRAVANLTDNALKYAGSGAIRIVVDDHRDRIAISVIDEGPGIPAELRTDAMRKYRRLEEARTTEGSGLGLAMVRAVARLHGGDLELGDNQPGLWATFVLRRD